MKLDISTRFTCSKKRHSIDHQLDHLLLNIRSPIPFRSLILQKKVILSQWFPHWLTMSYHYLVILAPWTHHLTLRKVTQPESSTSTVRSVSINDSSVSGSSSRTWALFGGHRSPNWEVEKPVVFMEYVDINIHIPYIQWNMVHMFLTNIPVEYGICFFWGRNQPKQWDWTG